MLTGAGAEPMKRGVPVESVKFGRGISSTSFAITASLADLALRIAEDQAVEIDCLRLAQSFVRDEEERLAPGRSVRRDCAPNWLRLKGGGLLEVKVKKLRASSALLRKNSNSSPWNSLVPERVATLTTAPELWPYSALKVELSILNS